VSVEKEIDEQYQNGEILLRERTKHHGSSVGRLSPIHRSNFSPRSALQQSKLPPRPDAKVRKNNSLLKFHKEREEFLNENSRYKAFLKKSLEAFRTNVGNKVDSFNLKVP